MRSRWTGRGRRYVSLALAVVACGLLLGGGTLRAASTAATATSYREDVLADSPRAYWRLGESSGTAAADETGTNPGTYSNVGLNEPGALASEVNASASFDGTKSYVSVPNSSSLNLTSAVTVEFWAKRRTTGGGYQVVVGKPGDGQSQNENYAVWLTNNNRYQSYFGNGSTFVSAQTPQVTDTNWHYVVATYDGSSVKIYLDGALSGSTSTNLKLAANTKPLNIGRSNANTYFFNGWLDEVALYPTALSASRIQAHYAKATTDLVPPNVTLTAPANGSVLTSTAVGFGGTAGAATGDSSTVTVKVYSGTSASGTPAQTLTATRQANSSYSVSATVAAGTWTAQAAQSDAAGNVGQSSPVTFTVSTAAPQATITSAPPDPTNQTTATFGFSADKPASFQCKLDSGAAASCTSPKTYVGLADGSHTFQVEASDQAGRSTTASSTWTIDTVPPPQPTITSGPASQTTAATATFDFADAEAGAAFRCQLDGSGFAACTSPKSYSGLTVGVHSFQVKARDAAGNESGAATSTWTINADVPPVPTFDATPASLDDAPTATFSFSDAQAGVTFECSLDASPFATCTSPTVVTDLQDGSHTFRVRARNGAGDPSAARSYTWTVDTTAPAETISSKPPNPSNSRNASFSFTSNEAAVFACALDGASPEPCTSPQTYAGLLDGSHTFRLDAIDEVGNDSTLSYTWTIDTSAPITTIESSPPNPSGSANASFSFTATEPAEFECALDGGAFSSCASPQLYSDLADGSHTFQVRAIDDASNTGPAASFGWTVATAPPPAPTITASPASVTSSTTANLEFSDAAADVTLLCQLDGDGFSACTSPLEYTDLADGTHTFDVKARRSSSGLESAAASYSWTVDSAPPVTVLAAAPPDLSNASTATFEFLANEPATFQCKLDAGAFAACATPKAYAGLADGSHTFQVKATDQAGNAGLAATKTWTIDTTPPTITLTSPANGSTRGVWPSFTGTAGIAPRDAATVTVRLYSGSAATGSPLQTLSAAVGPGGDYAATTTAPLSTGTYTVQAQQADSLGNTASTPANTFSVAGDPVVLAAGNIAACAVNGATRTASLLSREPDAVVMPLGNNAYPNGQPVDYQNCYDPTWGIAKARTRPVIGKHDMDVVPGGPTAGTGYVNYFADQLAPLGATASDRTKLYYSYDLGAWHVVVLDDGCIEFYTPNCDEAAQEQWLKNDLTTHPNVCTVAAFHTPLYSSGSVHPSRPPLQAFWSILYQYGVDLVLNADAKDYERFAPQDADGTLDNAYGIREIVVGLGGNGIEALGTLLANSQAFDTSSYGVLKLTLRGSSYDWRYIPVADGTSPAGGSFADSGSGTCHGAPPLSGYRSAVLAASPVSYWRLGETSGTAAADEQGANPGTYSNVQLNQPGALAGDTDPAASFDGVRSYVLVPDSNSLDLTTGATVEFWVKRRTISNTYQVLVGKPGDGISQNENYGVWITNTNRYQVYFGNGTSFATVQTPVMTDTNWHYIAATDDGSTVKIYVDGVLRQSATTTLRLTANAKPLNLGRANANTYFFNGWLDEVAIYPTALSATTIAAHYTAGTTPP